MLHKSRRSPDREAAALLFRALNRAVYTVVQVIYALLRLLPRRTAVALGAAVGRAYARLHGPRTGTARRNLKLAFPDWSEARRREVLYECFANLGRHGVETALLSRMTRDDVRELVRIEGLEHLDRARKRSASGGVVLLTAHFGSFELMAVACGLYGFPISLVHREIENPYINELVNGWRRNAGVEVLRRGSAARAALRALRGGRLLAMPLDQNAKRREGIYVPFFGRPASTRHAPARLAMRTGSPVVPVFIFREPDGVRHVVRIGPEVELVPDGPERSDAVWENVRRMTAAIENAVQEAPDQWIWIHRRWKHERRAKAASRTAAEKSRPGSQPGSGSAAGGDAVPAGVSRTEP